MIPIYIDTDLSLGTPGAEIDDGAALMMLLRTPQFDVRGLGTVHGNVSAMHATHNTLRLLSYLGREDIRVGHGAELPLIEDPSWFDEWKERYYGPTPPWPGSDNLPSAVNVLIDAVRAAPREITLLAIGSLTNLALAARTAPDIVEKVREVIVMGGSFDSAKPTAEFNIRNDPEAAHIVFTVGWPLRLFGLDITRQVLFTSDEFADLNETDAASALLKEQAPGWIDVVEEQGFQSGGCALHDAIAVAALVDDALFEYIDADVSVELTDSTKRGMTLIEGATNGRKKGAVKVAVKVDVGQCHDLIWSVLMGDQAR